MPSKMIEIVNPVARYAGACAARLPFYVDTISINDNPWLDSKGLPHTDALHVVERVRRVDHKSLQDEITIEDAKAYTGPWTAQKFYIANIPLPKTSDDRTIRPENIIASPDRRSLFDFIGDALAVLWKDRPKNKMKLSSFNPLDGGFVLNGDCPHCGKSAAFLPITPTHKEEGFARKDR